jgi:hypothetical protein
MSIFDAMKKFFLAFLLLAGAGLLSGCSDNKGDDEPTLITVTSGAFILNKGSLTYVSFVDNSSREITGLDLGQEPGDVLAYGGKVYVACPSRDAVLVLDKETFAPIATVSTTGELGDEEGKTPRHLTAYGNSVFVSTYGGYVGGIDTTSFALLAKYQVGSYPEGMCLGEEDDVVSLYVANSDADNGNGSISIINLKSKSVNTIRNENIKKPQKLAVAGSYIYVLDGGEDSGLYEINGTSARMIVRNATGMTAAGYGILTVNTPPDGTFSFTLYDIRYGTTQNLPLYGGSEHPLVDPTAIGVDYNTGYVMVTSRQSDPATPGFANLYNGSGDFVYSYPVGIEATDISFQYRTAKVYY